MVGIGATVLNGAVVGRECIIAAGALVPPGKELESGWLYMGNPARAHRELTEDERRLLTYSAGHYVELAGRHAAGQ